MSLDRLDPYNVEQAVALLSGKISLQALNSPAKPVQSYCADMLTSNNFWQGKAVSRHHAGNGFHTAGVSVEELEKDQGI
ncbi:MAG: hypothetical protein ACI9W6_000336 [Motiliproteus sp.]|jgi:hypothetical protein